MYAVNIAKKKAYRMYQIRCTEFTVFSIPFHIVHDREKIPKRREKDVEGESRTLLWLYLVTRIFHQSFH